MTTRVTAENFDSFSLSDLDGPRITSITVTNSSYVSTGAANVSTSGGYVQIVGANFSSPMQVFLFDGNTTPATSVTYVNSTTINVQLPAKAAKSYTCVTERTYDGKFALKINGITYA